MTQDSGNEKKEAELMVEILDFARCHGRKITEGQAKSLGGEKAQSTLQKLFVGEYLEKIEKKDFPAFCTLTSKGLNLFEEMRKSEPVPETSRICIVEKIEKAMTELEVKPWEVMVHIIHIIGKRPATAGDIEAHFNTYFPDIKGTSRGNIYRNIKHLRMKGYIEYAKKSHIDQSWYRLSKKGEEIFYMTKADATRKLRTSEEWDEALKHIFNKFDKERKEDEQALFYTLESILPEDLDKAQIVWALYTQGSVYELKGNLDKAEDVYLCMEGICEELENSKGRAYALKGLGNVAFKKDRPSKAEQYYTRCQRIAEEIQDPLLLSDVLNNVGSCLYMNDDVDEALHLLEKTFTLAEHDTFKKASTLYNEGLCYARKEDFKKAKELWLKSLRLYKKVQQPVEIKKVKSNLRQIDRKEKEEYLEEKYRKALKTGTSKDMKKAYEKLAKLKMDYLIESTRINP